MVIKTVRMRHPHPGLPQRASPPGEWNSRSEVGLTLIGRCKGKRFVALAGDSRIVFDANLDYVEEESAKHWRKNAHE